jgi:CSLREA domain-containing protein
LRVRVDRPAKVPPSLRGALARSPGGAWLSPRLLWDCWRWASARVGAQAQTPRLWLGTAQSSKASSYKGPVQAVRAMAAHPAAVSMAACDLDGDGITDVAIGMNVSGSGLVAIHRGNLDAFAPQSEASFEAIARGEFPSPYLPQAEVIDIPSRPDFLACGDFIGLGGAALVAATRGGHSIFVLARDSSGGLAVQQILSTPGAITGLDSYDRKFGKYWQLAVGVHTSNGPQLLLYSGANNGLRQARAIPLSGDATAFASGNLDDGPTPGLLVIAGGKPAILHGQSQRLEPVSVGYAVTAAVPGRFVFDRDPLLQIALLVSDGSVHILARSDIDSTPRTVSEMRAIRIRNVQTRLARAQDTEAPAQPAGERSVEWEEIESEPGLGPAGQAGSPAAMFRTRITNNGADDLALVGPSGLSVLSHPDDNPTASIVLTRDDLAADAVAALPVRVNIDARPGLVYVPRGATDASVVMPLVSQTFNVNTTADFVSSNSSACASNVSGQCSLREAIVEANANSSGTTTIMIPNSTYTLTIPRSDFTSGPTYDAHYGTLDVTESVNLVGASQNGTIIQAGTNSGTGPSPNGVDKVFSFNPDVFSYTNASVAVSNLLIQNGYNRGDYTTYFDGAGGAFDCDTGSSGNATVSLTNVTLNQNYALPEDGGGFAAFNDLLGSGSVTVTNGIIENNKAGGRDAFGWGGGVSVEDAAFLTMTGTTVSGNSAKENGGGIGDAGSGANFNGQGFLNNLVTLHGVTVTSNTAGDAGGGIYSGGGGLTIDQNSVISNNTSPSNGGGLYVAIYSNSTNPSYNVSFSNITVTDNHTTAASQAYGGGIYVTGGDQNATVFTMNYSRIVGNTSATSPTGAGLSWEEAGSSGDATNLQSINIADNWWGTNSDPATLGIIAFNPDGATNGTITYTPYLELTTSANPALVTVGGSDTSTVTASFLKDSGGNAVSASNLGALVGVPITFGDAVDGSLSAAQTTVQSSGTATATFTGTTVGSGSAQATVDGQSVTADITVDATTATAAANAAAIFSARSQSVTLLAAVTSAGGTVKAGTVTFSVFNGGTQIGASTSPASVANGSASASYTLPGGTSPGSYSIVASYTGAGSFTSSSDNTHTLTVSAAGTTTTASNQTTPSSSNSKSVTLSATVTSAAGTVNTGTVTFSVFQDATQIGASTGAASVANGSASASYTLPGGTSPGTYSIVASYTGAGGFTSSSDNTHTLTVVPAIGSCTTANPNPNPNPQSFAAVGDFNGDCRSDILWRNNSTEQVYEWLMNGTTFTGSGSPGSLTSDWIIQGVGDFNADGMADILWRNSTTGEVDIWLMNGTTMTSSVSLGYVSSDWTIAGVGDFNGDGNADILWQNTSGELYLWFMNGTTLTSAASLGYVSSGWNIAGIGDFNADGDADILWRNSTTGQVYVWLMNGTTIASMGSPGTPTSDWSIAGVGDFDGDGKSDILWRNSTTGEVFLWFMNGTTFASSGSVSYVSSDWSIAGAGDYDGSGRAGILWRNSTSGQVYIWLMNGTAITSTGSPGTPAAAWQIAP